jgi:hypothetical protein
VSITKRGRAIVGPVVRASERIYAELAAELGANRLRELYRSLDLLIAMSAGSSAADEGTAARRKARSNGAAASPAS